MFENPESAGGDVYFGNKSATECASVLLARATSFYNVLSSNYYLTKINSMWRAYHGSYSDSMGFGHKVDFTGEQGELVSLPVNHFRNLAQHIYVMITATRPIMEARAINTDYKSLAQTYLATGILEYYMREKGLENALKKATEMAIVTGSGFIKLDWNATAGEAFDVDDETGEFNYEGEIEFTNLSPLDVVVDGTKETWDNDWITVRTFKNRFDLIAKYPEFKDKIRGIPPKTQSSTYRLAIFSNDETDDIPVYEFYHKKTECMPDGRYMLFLDSDIVLLDTKMPYREIPVFRIVPSEIMGTPYGYSPMFDIFPIQEAINSLYSTIMTNQNAFGVQNIYIPRGADINWTQLEGAMNVIEANAKPEALNLTATPPEVFKFLDYLIHTAETLSGVNSVARGNPEASLKSGNALALVQSMALQFMSGLQQSYVQLIEDVGSSVINILKDFATTPKVVALVGKNNRPLLKEFTGENISAINRVVVDMGNPLSRTIAGRVQMAEQMMQMGIIKNPEQYIQVMNTGRIDSMFEGEMSELMLIKSENESLMEGKDIIVSPLDSHRMHITEHKAVLADPDMRKDQTLVKSVIDHIEQHMDALRNTDPALLQLIGEQPLAPPQGPPPGAGPSGPVPPPSQSNSAQGGPSAPQQAPHGAPHSQTAPKGPMATPPGGLPAPGTPIKGPQGTEKMPSPAKVNGSLLPNAAAQESAMNNVKQ